jgi:hypothetical protein
LVVLVTFYLAFFSNLQTSLRQSRSEETNQKASQGRFPHTWNIKLNWSTNFMTAVPFGMWSGWSRYWIWCNLSERLSASGLMSKMFKPLFRRGTFFELFVIRR